MPRSVMMPAMSACGVTSKAGFQTSAPSGVDLRPADVRHFAGAALFDRNVMAVGRRQVDGRERRGHVERNAVFAREDGHGVGADLVGGVAVGGDPIGADDHQIDPALPHEGSGHVVRDDRRLNAVPDELPRGQARALEKRARLVREHGDLLAGFDSAANDAQRRAVPGGRERARVAVRQDARRRPARWPRRTRPSPGSWRRLRRGSPRPRDRGGP